MNTKLKIIVGCLLLASLLLIAACKKNDDKATDTTRFYVLSEDASKTESKTEQPTSKNTDATTAEAATEQTTAKAAETTKAAEETPAPEQQNETTAASNSEAQNPTSQDPTNHSNGSTGNIAATAKSLIGTTFEYGADGPKTFDNSGFVYYCCKENGVNIPRRTSQIATAGKEVSRDQLQSGDIVIFSMENGGSADFAGIYVGDGQFISCNSEQTPTAMHSLDSGFWADHFIGGRHVAD